MSNDLSWLDKGRVLYRVAAFKPVLTVGVILISFLVALLEGVGVRFIYPIVELAQGEMSPDETSGLLGWFVEAYAIVGIPFTLGFLVMGVGLVMSVRYLMSFLVDWIRIAVQTHYVRHLQQTAFDMSLDAEVSYFDDEGSDDILNAIVTQAEYAGKTIKYTIHTFESALLTLMYLTIALYLAPVLTVVSAAVFIMMVLLFRVVLQTGYSIGDRVASANERIQEVAQSGTQGIRDVKVYGLANELRQEFTRAVNQYTSAHVALGRNQAAIDKFYNLAAAITVFVLIYIAISQLSMSLGALGLFLFVIFRLGPTLSSLNSRFYKLEGYLPHLVRTLAFIDQLEKRPDHTGGSRNPPMPIETLEVRDAAFSYSEGERILEDISFSVDRGEFVAFVGPSGVGKSTIASVLARLYLLDEGSIRANGIPVEEFDLHAWRDRIGFVRQSPYMFDETLRWNLTVGNRGASQDEIDRICELTMVTEFIDELPDGYDTELGDNGVKLSGGQRQRVALARALLKQPDLLILDEATSELDSHLERTVQSGFEQLRSDCMIVAIAHHLSTIENATRIYTVKDGTIAEQGDHEHLLDKRGPYAELYSMQSRSA